MVTTLNRNAFARLIVEDLAWLNKQPRSLERDHIAHILQQALDREYPMLVVDLTGKQPLPPDDPKRGGLL